jgi:putative YphP/YqiW family bacilliredoxin
LKYGQLKLIWYLCDLLKFNTKKNKYMYPADLVKPMREDLTSIGFEELHSVEDVEAAMKKEGTTLVVVNSVCGCAAANARPGARISLQNTKKPDNLVTVFAGVDKEATDKARSLMVPFPPSSPSMALFKDGELVHMLERHHIEGRPAEMIAENLIGAYNEFC